MPGIDNHSEYDAFISYRTSIIPDGLAGEELQKLLESYPVPKSLKQSLARPSRFRNRLRIFRDTTDLSAGGDLGEAIKQKLRASRWLILVCSPNTLRSDYCADELSYFRAQHGEERVLYLLIAGEPDEVIPPTGGDQPLAADVRAEDTAGIIGKLRGKGLPKQKQALFKLLAPILGCKSPDDLIQRHRARVRVLASQIAASVLLVAGGLSWVAFNQNRKEAIRSEAERHLAGIGLGDEMFTQERVSLRKLAASAPEVRLEFLKQAVRIHPARFNRRSNIIVRAALGIDPAMARKAEDEILAKFESGDSAPLEEATCHALLGLALPVENPSFLVSSFKTLLLQPEILQPNGRGGSRDPSISSRTLYDQFWHRVRSLEGTKARAVVPLVLQQMEREEDAWILSRWSLFLAELKSVRSDELRVVTDKIMKKIEQASPDSESDDQGGEVVEILTPYCQMWGAVQGELTELDVESFVPLMIRSLLAEDTVIGIERIQGLFAEWLNRTPPQARLKAGPFLIAALKKGESAEYLDGVLTSCSDVLSPELRKQRIEALLDLMTSQSTVWIVKSLAKLPGLSRENLARMSTRLVDLIFQPSQEGEMFPSLALREVSEAIAALPSPLAPQDYWKVAGELVAKMKAQTSDLTDVEFRGLAEALEKLPAPPAPAMGGKQLHSEIVSEIAAVNLDALFFEDRLESWFGVLNALGGELPLAVREQLGQKLMVKMDAASKGYDVTHVIDAIFTVGCDSMSARKVILRIVDLCENDPSFGFHVIHNSGLSGWHPILFPADYGQAFVQIAEALDRGKRGERELLILLQWLPRPAESIEMSELIKELSGRIENMKGLDAVTKARLVCFLEKRPLATTDFKETSDLLTVLTTLVGNDPGQSGMKFDFPQVDHERVVQTLVSAIESDLNPEKVYPLAGAFSSLPFSPAVSVREKVAISVATAWAASKGEQEIRMGSALLSEGGASLSGGASHAVMGRLIRLLSEADNSAEVASWVSAFESIPASFEATDMEGFSEEFLDAMELEPSEWLLPYFYRLLGKISPPFTDEQRRRAAKPVLRQLEKVGKPVPEGEERYQAPREQLREWLGALAEIPGGALPEDQKLANRLAIGILAETEYPGMGNGFQEDESFELLPEVEIPLLLDALKRPTLVADLEDEILNRLGKQSGQSFQRDIWKAAKWAKTAGFDVSSAPPTQ